MKPEDESRVWMIPGALGSMAIGIALIPMRSFTSASNLAFVFLVFAIVVAELGGRSAALVTAVMSAISLNFFLTEPYLTLAISKSDDLVAFFALAGCGLVAAAFGKRRERWSELAGRARQDLDVVNGLVERLKAGAPLDEILGHLRQSFGFSAVVLRDENERILASVPIGMTPPIPETEVAADTFLPSKGPRLRFGKTGLRLPAGGGRLKVRSDGGSVSLDLWEGDTKGFGLLEARALTIAASILVLDLSRRRAE